MDQTNVVLIEVEFVDAEPTVRRYHLTDVETHDHYAAYRAFRPDAEQIGELMSQADAEARDRAARYAELLRLAGWQFSPTDTYPTELGGTSL